MPDHDVAIVGGGCVGCSVAKHLPDLDVAVVEKEHRLAAHQSGRNSGVLHPGFNYEPGSLKAEFAVEGTRRMKAYCREHDLPLDECGVVVVAQDQREVARLRDLRAQAQENGVEVSLVDEAGLAELEPHAEGVAALHCPAAAAVDGQQYVYRLAADARADGTQFYVGHPVTGVERTAEGYRLRTDAGDVTARVLVNAAGLQADRIAHEVGVGEGYRVVPFRGDYYELTADRRDLCRSMVYPTPDPELPFLGVHYTRRTDGSVIVGPNAVLAFAREGYAPTDVSLRDLREVLGFEGFWRLFASGTMLRVAAAELGKSYSKERFVAAARRLVPEVREPDLVRSFAGVRAQLVSEAGELVSDPLFETDDRAVHVLNAVSPGLTCSLPFGEHVAGLVRERASGGREAR